MVINGCTGNDGTCMNLLLTLPESQYLTTIVPILLARYIFTSYDIYYNFISFYTNQSHGMMQVEEKKYDYGQIRELNFNPPFPIPTQKQIEKNLYA